MAVVRRLIPAVAAILLCTTRLQAQEVGSIRGKVVDSTSQQGLTNVTLLIEGTQRGTISRPDGSFDLTGVPAGSQRLRARRIGYHTIVVTVTVPAGGSATTAVAMVPQPAVLTEIVATGYGSQRREAITGSVSTIDAGVAKVGVVTNATEMLQARTPGVQIVQSSGEPGGNTQIRIRGGTSISASNDPLYVLDGVPLQNEATAPGAAGVSFNAALSRNPLNSISPDDIESMTILKDASATAIYGSRGANGVILITTKRGQRQSQIEYETYIGMASPRATLDLATGDQYRAFVNQWKDSIGGATAVAALGNANTNWEKQITQSSLSMNHSLAFTGGSEQTKYRASLNYFDQDGVIINSGLKRYQGRLNATHDALSGKLRLALNLMSSHVNNQYSPNENGGGFNGGLFTNMIIYNPTFPVNCSANVKPCTAASAAFYESGPTGVFNPAGLVNQVSDLAPENRLLGNFTTTISLREDLTAQTTLGADQSDAVRRTYLPRSSPLGGQFNGYARQVNKALNETNFQQLLTYTPRSFSNQEVELVAGYEYVYQNNREFGSASQNFISDAFSFDNMVAGGSVPAGYPYSWRSESKLASFFGRANWGFANRYFITGVLRRDGSSRLAPGHEWATFPGISGSWKLSEESFMQNFRPLGLSSLALRLGWGRQGNQSILPYQTLLLLKSDPGALYPFGGAIASGLAAAQVGNPDLKWETADQTNFGMDYSFARDRVTGSIDVYQKNTHDLLQTVPVPQPAVVSNQIKNIGSIRNRGLEANANMQLWSAGNRSLSGGLVLTVERNTVTSLGDTSAACVKDATSKSFKDYTSAGCLYYRSGTVYGQGQSDQWSEVIMRGQAIGTFLMPKFLGVENGVQQFACSTGTAGCVNGKTSAPVDADRQFVGTANPSFTLGVTNSLTWNSLDASWLWRGEFGGNVLNNTALVYQTRSAAAQGRNMLAKALTDPDNIHEPAKLSTRWLEDRTFVRLQNVTVGYNLPRALLKGRTSRVFVSSDNVLLFTKYSGYDPEVFVAAGLAARGIDYATYPPTRKFTIGARTQF
ncbi:MAG TPA: SusC/RagA family TonB-linked outer membrane protein [Gemmatimonadaceae bacterium]|nr:SusC/RagA family TonB-linked outer membrane protein [Gemmatimonadaceae bacterium]